MNRGLSEATRNTLGNRSLKMATFMKIYFTTPAKFTDYLSTVSADLMGDGYESFTPDKFWLDYEDVSESSKLQVGELKVTLSATDAAKTYLNIALNNEYLNKRVLIRRAFINDSGTVVGAPFTLYDGYIKAYDFEEDNRDSFIDFTVASHWADFEKINCRRTNPASQGRYFPNDSAFNWAHETQQDIRWGRK